MALAPRDSNIVNRSSRADSIVSVYKVPDESIQDLSDQAALPNLNANWVNAKGAWLIHFIVIGCVKIVLDTIPGMTQQLSWTFTNLSYAVGSYLMFHYFTGVPFDFNSGAYDNLSMWEQIDNGDQYTPAKKFLLSVPIILFLASTHYTNYDIQYFVISLIATLAVVIPKLPSTHRLRVGIFSSPPVEDQ